MRTMGKRGPVWTILCVIAALGLPAGLSAQDAKPPAGTAAPVATPKPAPPADPIAVLKQIPANATAFVAIRNLVELDSDVTAVTKKLGFDLEQMGIPNLLTMLQEQIEIKDGLNTNSGVAMVLLDCSQVKESAEIQKRAVMIIPTTDPDKMVEAMKGTKEGSTYKFQMGEFEGAGIARNGFLILCKDAETLREVEQVKDDGIAKALSPDRMKAYNSSDIFAWISLRGISKDIRTEAINTIKGLLLFAQASSTGGADQLETSMAQITKFADECKELSLSVSLDQKVGLAINFAMRAMPDTELARQIAATKPLTSSALAGLPDEPVVLAMGISGGAGNPLYEKSLKDQLDQVLTPDVLGEIVDEAQIAALKESILKLVPSFESMGLSISGLPPEGQDGLIAVTMVGKTANSQQAQAEVRKLAATIKDMIIKVAVKEGGISEEDAKTVADAVQWKENAEKLSGAVVDHLTVDLSKLPDTEPEQIDQVKGIIGQEGILIRVAAVGDKHIVVTFGGGPKRFAQVMDLVQKGQAPLAERKTIKMLAERLPAEKRVGEVYFSIDRLLALVMDISTRSGSPMPFPLSMKEAAPIALVMNQTDEAAYEGTLLIPIELAQSVVEAAQPFIQMMMMGGAGGGMGPGMAPSTEEGEESGVEPAPAPAPSGN